MGCSGVGGVSWNSGEELEWLRLLVGVFGEPTCPVCPARFSHMIQDKALRSSWARKMKERQERKLVRDLARQLEEAKQREKEVTRLGSWRIPAFPKHHPVSLPSSRVSKLWQSAGKRAAGMENSLSWCQIQAVVVTCSQSLTRNKPPGSVPASPGVEKVLE